MAIPKPNPGACIQRNTDKDVSLAFCVDENTEHDVKVWIKIDRADKYVHMQKVYIHMRPWTVLLDGKPNLHYHKKDTLLLSTYSLALVSYNCQCSLKEKAFKKKALLVTVIPALWPKMGESVRQKKSTVVFVLFHLQLCTPKAHFLHDVSWKQEGRQMQPWEAKIENTLKIKKFRHGTKKRACEGG